MMRNADDADTTDILPKATKKTMVSQPPPSLLPLLSSVSFSFPAFQFSAVQRVASSFDAAEWRDVLLNEADRHQKADTLTAEMLKWGTKLTE
jgi:hypothetical protein